MLENGSNTYIAMTISSASVLSWSMTASSS